MLAQKQRVSLCMIVRDEEKNLEACLAPIAGLVDEIIIVDTGSRDATKEIARRFTPHVYDFTWCDNFASARNESLRHATGDWVFWLDADDRVRPDQIPLLRKLFAQLDDRPRAIFMDILLQAPTAREETSVVSHARLFRRQAEVRWEGRVHEQVWPTLEALGYERVYADVQIDHGGYADRALAQRKLRRKLRLLRMEYAVNPDDKSVLLHLASALWGTHSLDEAHAHLMRLIQRRDGNAEYVRWAYEMITELSLARGKVEEALRLAFRGLELFPGCEQLLYLQAMAYYRLCDYSSAGRTLQQLISSPHQRQISFASPANIRTKVAPRLLGTVLRMQRQYDQAAAVFRHVLSQFPGDIVTWFDLGLVSIDRGDGTGVKSVGAQLLTLPDGRPHAGTLAALWHLRHGDVAIAGKLIDELVTSERDMILPRMLQAEWLSRVCAPIEAQIRALREILRLAPGNLEARRFLQLAQAHQAAPASPAAQPQFAAAPAVPVAAAA